MAFPPGPVNTVGITPSFLQSLTTQTAQSGVELALGQVWQGAGQSFLGSAGQSLVGNLAGSAVNIAVSNLVGTQVANVGGINLASGSNFLASTITPLITSTASAAINQNIQQALQSAGPFGPALSSVGTGLVNQLFQGIGDSLTQSLTSTPNVKLFPGAGDEPPADYGGSSYTLGPNGTDVVFSIQPANVGPQQFGVDEAVNFPKSITTLPFTELTSMPLLAGNPTINQLKQSTMLSGFTSVDPRSPFSSAIA